MLASVGATLLPFLGAVPGSVITRRNIDSWYRHIKKPSWRPPNWAFGPVWTALYAGTGYASYLVWRDGGSAACLGLYTSQLLLNWAWTPIFFGLHHVKAAFYVICLLWVASLATGLSFYSVNQAAGLLFIPYQIWLTLAATLNYVIWRDNGDQPSASSAD